MIIRTKTNFHGVLDLSALERLQEDNPLEKYPFRLYMRPGETVTVDDKWYYLHNIQQALKSGYIEILDYYEQNVFSQEISVPESYTNNYSLTKVEILNRYDYPQESFEKYNTNMDTIDGVTNAISQTVNNMFVGLHQITVGPTPPASPALYDLWVDTN